MLTLLYVLHFMVCFVLIAVVLLQRGKGSDLGAALGGGGANTVFGSRGAGNFLSRITTASAIIFMGTSLSLAYFGAQYSELDLFEDAEIETEAPIGDLTPIDEAIPSGTTGSAGDLEEIPTGELGGLEEIPAPLEGAGQTTD